MEFRMKKVWVVQYREVGEEDQVFLATSEEKAREIAYNTLWHILQWRLDGTGIEIPNTLEDAERLCFDEEYAYISIYEQGVE
tara:strand:- start:90 stop:335 length:246 start_codon:yes stop_codon:yes gene_type:complete